MTRFSFRTVMMTMAGLAAIVMGAWLLSHVLIVDGVFTRGYTSVGHVLPDIHDACTGTLVGPRVVITAAHCVPRDPGTAITFEHDHGTTEAHCWRVPGYVAPPNRDLALCRLDNAPKDLTPERLGRRGLPILSSHVAYVGYGCSKVRKWLTRMLHHQQGERRYGTGKIVESVEEVLTIVGHEICDGDSGGPVFLGQPEAGGPLVGVLSWHTQDTEPTRPLAVSVVVASMRDALNRIRDDQSLVICEDDVAHDGCPSPNSMRLPDASSRLWVRAERTHTDPRSDQNLTLYTTRKSRPISGARSFR
jgi:Trypsin